MSHTFSSAAWLVDKHIAFKFAYETLYHAVASLGRQWKVG